MWSERLRLQVAMVNGVHWVFCNKCADVWHCLFLCVSASVNLATAVSRTLNRAGHMAKVKPSDDSLYNGTLFLSLSPNRNLYAWRRV